MVLLRPSGCVILEECAKRCIKGWKPKKEEKADEESEKAEKADKKKVSKSTKTEGPQQDDSSETVDPMNGEKLNLEEDVISLVPGFTGFSAHNETEAKVFSHTRAGHMEARDRGGSLGAKGTAFR